MRRTFIAAPAVLSQFGASGSTQGSLHVTSSVSVRGWSIQSHMAPISSEAEADDIRDAIRAVAAAEGHAQISQLFALPEILFGSNALHLLLEDGTFELRISCKGALCQWARVAATAEDVPEGALVWVLRGQTCEVDRETRQLASTEDNGVRNFPTQWRQQQLGRMGRQLRQRPLEKTSPMASPGSTSTGRTTPSMPGRCVAQRKSPSAPFFPA